MPTIMWFAAAFSTPDPSFPFFTRPMSSELPWHVESESTYIFRRHPTSVALHGIVNPLPHVCWPAYRKSNPGCGSNRLKLNASKTVFIWIGTRQQLSMVDEEALMVCEQSVTLMVKVRCRERRSSATSSGFERCCETRCWYYRKFSHVNMTSTENLNS